MATTYDTGAAMQRRGGQQRFEAPLSADEACKQPLRVPQVMAALEELQRSATALEETVDRLSGKLAGVLVEPIGRTPPCPAASTPGKPLAPLAARLLEIDSQMIEQAKRLDALVDALEL